VKEKEDARIILKNLQKGADFSWWARRKSVDSSSATGGDAGWFTKDSLPQPLQMIIDTLKPGDITPVLEVNTHYMVARLKEKVDKKVREFSAVKDAVRRSLFNDQRNTVLKDYIARLKADAEIKFYDKQIQLLEEKLLR
jgi:peptidyl-prolyl cis-trans isomerase C